MTQTRSNLHEIDMTPTWETCVRIYMAVLENPNAGRDGKGAARAELLRLAKFVDDGRKTEVSSEFKASITPEPKDTP